MQTRMRSTPGAHLLIDFLLRPEVAARTVKTVLVAPTVQSVANFLEPSLRSNALLFPAANVMSRFEMMDDLGDALRLYYRAWTEIKAGQ